MDEQTQDQTSAAPAPADNVIERIEHAASDAVHAIEETAAKLIHSAEAALHINEPAQGDAAVSDNGLTDEQTQASPSVAGLTNDVQPSDEAATPRMPQVGDAALYWPGHGFNGSFPIMATVLHVWTDTCVNLAMKDSNGGDFNPTSVLLVRASMPVEQRPMGSYAMLADEAGETPMVDAYFVAPPAPAPLEQHSHAPIFSLDAARALLEVLPDCACTPVKPLHDHEIVSFIDSDGRTMRVVVHESQGIVKQAVPA